MLLELTVRFSYRVNILAPWNLSHLSYFKQRQSIFSYPCGQGVKLEFPLIYRLMCGNKEKSHYEIQGDVLNKQLTLQTNQYYIIGNYETKKSVLIKNAVKRWIYTQSGVDIGTTVTAVGVIIMTGINWSICPSSTLSTTNLTCTGRPDISLHSKGVSCWNIFEAIIFKYVSLPNNTDYKKPELLNYKNNVRENYGSVRKLMVKCANK